MVTNAERYGWETLGDTEQQVFYFTCPSCGRTGRYSRQTLLEQLGPDVTIVGGELAKQVALWRGCAQARFDAEHDWSASDSRCHVRYDIAKMRPK